MDSSDLEKFNHGISLAQAGKKDEAYQRFKALSLSYPDDVNLLLWLAYTSPNPPGAKALIEKAIRIDPSNPNLQDAKNWFDKTYPSTSKPKTDTANSPPPQAQYAANQTTQAGPRVQYPNPATYPINNTFVSKKKEPSFITNYLGYLICCGVPIAVLYLAGEKVISYLKDETTRVINSTNNSVLVALEIEKLNKNIANVWYLGLSILFFIIACLAGWIAEDAKKRRVRFGTEAADDPKEIFWYSLLLWPLFFPLYLTKRDISRYRFGEL